MFFHISYDISIKEKRNGSKSVNSFVITDIPFAGLLRRNYFYELSPRHMYVKIKTEWEPGRVVCYGFQRIPENPAYYRRKEVSYVT